MMILYYFYRFFRFRKTIKSLLIIFMSLGLIKHAYPVHAEELLQNNKRLNTGYYSSSLTENANRTDVEISLNIWAREIFENEHNNHGFDITYSKAVLFDRMEDMRTAFDQGELDMIVAPPILISRYFKRAELADGFRGVLSGNRQESMILVVRSNLKINSLKDLLGKRVEINENDELAVVFFDTLMLKEAHSSYKDGGLSIIKQQKSDRIVLDIYFDKADAGIVYGSSYEMMAELNPDINNKVTIFKTYPIKARNFSFFRHNYPYINEIYSGEVTFINSVRGKQIMEVFKTPGIDHCKVEELEPFDQLYKDYLALKKQAKK